MQVNVGEACMVPDHQSRILIMDFPLETLRLTLAVYGLSCVRQLLQGPHAAFENPAAP